MHAEVEQRHRDHVRAVSTGWLVALHDGLLRTAGAASGAVDEGYTQVPRRAVERERPAPRRADQQAWRCVAVKVSEKFMFQSMLL